MDIRVKLNPIDQRLATLKKHIEPTVLYINIKGKGVDRYGVSVFVAAHRYLKINPLPPIRLFFSTSAKTSIKFPRIRDMHKNLML